uniref:lipocalin-like domain-containing protein n=1 Tax=Pararhizobium sp. IMCC3301 TaxID=3067904 RepID=UPI0027423882|nr:lipocalin-like domain-containing protein [Pararhizobium sp. IMCC3301]
MNAKIRIALPLLIVPLWLALLWSAAPFGQAFGQGFAGLGGDSEGFAEVTPGKIFSFPQDHGAHPDFRIEWWYVTANLSDTAGNPYGIQWTLFRRALTPGSQQSGWNRQQLWLGHAALSAKGRHLSAEIAARGGTGQAGITTAPFAAWIDDWSLTSIAKQSPAAGAPGPDAFSEMRLTASDEAFSYDLTLATDKNLIFHGESGFSRKSDIGQSEGSQSGADQASYYYSQPFFTVSGTVSLDGKDIKVSGKAWLDREWSSQPLAASQTGWDWFSLHFDSGEKLMLFRLRDKEADNYTSGTWISPDGSATALTPDDIIMTPLQTARIAGRDVPVRWRLEVPGKGVEIETAALNADSWMLTSIPYWEGPVQVSGSHDGVGYLEMTGYAVGE